MTTVYISIGNSDDQLMQAEWAEFTKDIDQKISSTCRYVGTQVHGRGYSLPNEQWQNACWCIEVAPNMGNLLADLRKDLGIICARWRQDSITWTEGTTEFIGPDHG